MKISVNILLLPLTILGESYDKKLDLKYIFLIIQQLIPFSDILTKLFLLYYLVTSDLFYSFFLNRAQTRISLLH